MSRAMATAAPKVLVADDDADLVLLVSRRLQKEGYEVLTATDGKEALEKAVEHTPELAVLDVMMPKLTGVEVMEQLAADPATQGIRVVLISASFQEDGPGGGVPPGADDYVKKPFAGLDLPDRVRDVLSRTAGDGDSS